MNVSQKNQHIKTKERFLLLPTFLRLTKPFYSVNITMLSVLCASYSNASIYDHCLSLVIFPIICGNQGLLKKIKKCLSLTLKNKNVMIIKKKQNYDQKKNRSIPVNQGYSYESKTVNIVTNSIIVSQTFNHANIPYNKIPVRSMLSGVIKTSSKFTPALHHAGSHSVHLAKPVSVIPQAGVINTYVPQRKYASARAGKLNIKELSTEQLPTQSDITGKHKMGFIIGCENQNCKNTNCVKGTSATNPCKISGNTHKKPLKEISDDLEKAGFFMEVSGALTHKIPSDKKGTFVSPADMEKKPKIQYVVQENKTTVIPFKALKENQKVTAYCQEDRHTASLVRNLPEDSKLNITNKEPTSIGKQPKKPFEAIPKDDGF